jgi:hypothetical protein
MFFELFCSPWEIFRPFFLFSIFLFIGAHKTNSHKVLLAVLRENYPSTWGEFPVNLGKISRELRENFPSQLGANIETLPKQMWISRAGAVDKRLFRLNPLANLGKIPRHAYG